jgi:hypothetical protein
MWSVRRITRSTVNLSAIAVLLLSARTTERDNS